MSLPVSRPMGRALIVGSAACRSLPVQTLQRLSFNCAELDDPYSAMIELCRRPLVYRALVLSLASVYREELAIISSIKQRFPHVEIWLAQADGRLAALADAMRHGADGLVSEEGLHRTAVAAQVTPQVETVTPEESSHSREPEPIIEMNGREPVLTADELRALLQDQPTIPPTQ